MKKEIVWHVEKRKVADLKPHPDNARIFTEKGMQDLKRSINSIGMAQPINITPDGVVLSGHARLMALQEKGVEEVDVYIPNRELTAKEQQEVLIRMNANIAGLFDWDKAANIYEMDDLTDWGCEIPDLKVEEEKSDEDATPEEIAQLQDRFLCPPFSFLDTRQGYWQDRKRIWKKLIKENGESREGTLGFSSLINNMYGKQGLSNVSILDPVLCELMLSWFGMPKGGKAKCFDCFAGDTVFGYVSSFLGNSFTGIELRPEQAKINAERTKHLNAKYICDDGQNVAKHIPAESQDFFFSCPPYFDLEVYSDLENDASNQKDYESFRQILENAFTGAVKCLKPNRFAVVVMSNVRDHKDGHYYDICSDISRIFEKNGCILYNEIILLNVIGTAAIRAKQAMKNRKVCRVHQEVLVYYKGDPNKIKDEFGEVAVKEIEADENESGVEDESTDI